MSNLPLSVMVCSCHVCVDLSCLRSGFLDFIHADAALWQSSPSLITGWARDYQSEDVHEFNLCEIFNCIHLKSSFWEHVYSLSPFFFCVCVLVLNYLCGLGKRQSLKACCY